jgi:hypothetical protein
MAYTSEAKEMALRDPEAMKSYLLDHPLSRGGRMWCDRVLEGVNNYDRTAIRMYGEAMKWVGAQHNIANIFIGQLGLKDETELTRLVNSGKKFEELQAEGVNLERYRDDSIQVLKDVLKLHPEWRVQVMKELSSVAAEVGENGHG